MNRKPECAYDVLAEWWWRPPVTMNWLSVDEAYDARCALYAVGWVGDMAPHRIQLEHAMDLACTPPEAGR